MSKASDKNKRKQSDYASEEEEYDFIDYESDYSDYSDDDNSVNEEELKEFKGITLTSSDDSRSTTTITSPNKGATHYTEEESNLLLECIEKCSTPNIQWEVITPEFNSLNIKIERPLSSLRTRYRMNQNNTNTYQGNRKSFIKEEDEAIIRLVKKHTEQKPNWTPILEMYNSKAPKQRTLHALKARYYLMKKGGGIKFWDLNKKKRLLEICAGCLITRRDGDEVCWSKARQLFNTEFESNKSRSIIRAMWKLMRQDEEWKHVIDNCIKGELITPDDGKRFKMNHEETCTEDNQPIPMLRIEEMIKQIQGGFLTLGENSPFEERIAFRILVSEVMENYYTTNQCKRIGETSFHKLFAKFHDPREELERLIGHPCDEKFGVTKVCQFCQYFRPCHEATCMQCHYRHQHVDSTKGQAKECYYKSQYANNWLWYFVLKNVESFKEGSMMNPLDVDSLDYENHTSNEIFRYRKCTNLYDTIVDLNIEEVKKNSIINRLLNDDIVPFEYTIKEDEMEEEEDGIIDCDSENDDPDEVLVNNLSSSHYQRIMDRTDLKLSWLNDFVKDDCQSMSDWVCDNSINIIDATNEHRYELSKINYHNMIFLKTRNVVNPNRIIHYANSENELKYFEKVIEQVENHSPYKVLRNPFDVTKKNNILYLMAYLFSTMDPNKAILKYQVGITRLSLLDRLRGYQCMDNNTRQADLAVGLADLVVIFPLSVEETNLNVCNAEIENICKGIDSDFHSCLLNRSLENDFHSCRAKRICNGGIISPASGQLRVDGCTIHLLSLHLPKKKEKLFIIRNLNNRNVLEIYIVESNELVVRLPLFLLMNYDDFIKCFPNSPESIRMAVKECNQSPLLSRGVIKKIFMEERLSFGIRMTFSMPNCLRYFKFLADATHASLGEFIECDFHNECLIYENGARPFFTVANNVPGQQYYTLLYYYSALVKGLSNQQRNFLMVRTLSDEMSE